MAALAAQVITNAGVAPTYAAASGGGDTCPVGPRTFLHVKNASGGALTVTIDDLGTPLPPGSASNPDNVVSVPAAGERMIGPINAERFQQSTGVANITYSGVTSLTIGCFVGP